MHRFELCGQEIIITCDRRIHEKEFNRACIFINQLGEKLLNLKKSTIVLIQAPEDYYVVIERMSTDTYTLHVHYEIAYDRVYKLLDKEQ